MKVLILGGAGFLGNNLVRRCLSEKSCEITVLDSLDPLMHSSTQNLQEAWSSIRLLSNVFLDCCIVFCMVKKYKNAEKFRQ